MFQMERNPNVSRKDATSHVRSITNISTDLSNTERINRWVSAIRIAQDHPVVGSGPGTYQFIYAPYQLPQYQTYISTNTGTKGNAHSEFLGPLSETGIPGMLTVIAIVISLFVTGFRLFFKLKKLDTNRSMIAVSYTHLDVYKRQVNILQAQLDTITKYGALYKQINEQLALLNRRLIEFQQKYDEAKIDAFSKIPQKFVVEYAYPPDRKAYPVRWLIVVVSALAAFVLTLVCLIFYENYEKYKKKLKYSAR